MTRLPQCHKQVCKSYSHYNKVNLVNGWVALLACISDKCTAVMSGLVAAIAVLILLLPVSVVTNIIVIVIKKR